MSRKAMNSKTHSHKLLLSVIECPRYQSDKATRDLPRISPLWSHVRLKHMTSGGLTRFVCHQGVGGRFFYGSKMEPSCIFRDVFLERQKDL